MPSPPDQVVLVAGAHAEALVEAWDPDVVVGSTGRDVRRQVSTHELHPDLALLLSTSGTTGSPKLVRLGRDGLLANATAIAESLSIRPDDVAATTLPLHYCYGLSVLHSHLLMGAGLLLTDSSVVDEDFWADVATPRRHHHPRRAAHLRAARAQRLRRALDTVPAHPDPGRWPDGTGAGASLRRARPAPWLRPVRDVRRHGGHRPDERAAVRPRRGGTDLDRPPARGHDLPPRRPERRRRRRARLHRTQRHARLRHRRPPTSRWAGSSTSCAPATSLGSGRTACGRSSAGATGSRRSAGSGSTSTTSSARSATGDSSWPRADGGDRLVIGIADGARPVDVPALLAITTELAGVPAGLVDVVVLPDLPRLANGKVDYRALADARAGRAARRASGWWPEGRHSRRRHRPLRHSAGPPRRAADAVVRRPRRRLAVLCRGLAPARASAG